MEENECVDRLAKAASAEFMNGPKQVLSFVQTCSLIDDGKQIQEIDIEEDWTTPLKNIYSRALCRTGRTLQED